MRRALFGAVAAALAIGAVVLVVANTGDDDQPADPPPVAADATDADDDGPGDEQPGEVPPGFPAVGFLDAFEQVHGSGFDDHLESCRPAGSLIHDVVDDFVLYDPVEIGTVCASTHDSAFLREQFGELFPDLDEPGYVLTLGTFAPPPPAIQIQVGLGLDTPDGDRRPALAQGPGLNRVATDIVAFVIPASGRGVEVFDPFDFATSRVPVFHAGAENVHTWVVPVSALTPGTIAHAQMFGRAVEPGQRPEDTDPSASSLVTVGPVGPCVDVLGPCTYPPPPGRFTASLEVDGEVVTGEEYDDGSFWFLDRDVDLEVLVKVLQPDKALADFWVFHESLTDVGFELTVTDTESGLNNVYENPPGTFASVGDTSSF